MNGQEMLRLIDSIARDRNIDKEVLFRDLEQAMVSAARKHFNAEDTDEFQSEVDRINGQIRVWHNQEEVPLATLGRIPAQTAKQVMIQRFREDEREAIYNEYIDRVGELTTGMARAMRAAPWSCRSAGPRASCPVPSRSPASSISPVNASAASFWTCAMRATR